MLFDDIEPQQRGKRNRDGSIPATYLKAIHWYCIEHALKLQATSVYPSIELRSTDEQIIDIHVNDIVRDYDEFKEQKYGKRKAA